MNKKFIYTAPFLRVLDSITSSSASCRDGTHANITRGADAEYMWCTSTGSSINKTWACLSGSTDDYRVCGNGNQPRSCATGTAAGDRGDCGVGGTPNGIYVCDNGVGPA